MSNAEPATRVIIAMLKAPRAGLVKTRLAREIGADPAAAAYRRLVEHQMASLPPDWRVEIHFAPADAEDEMRRWLGDGRDYYAQVGAHLGERLVCATEGAFARHAGPVIVIGGDCPGLNRAVVCKASSALGSADVAIGPALDGGYYLIGLSRPAPKVFQDIPWSTSEVFAVTINRIGEAGLTHFELPALEDVHFELPALEDVDDLPSWIRLQSLLPVAEARAHCA
jgi:uncharacterized protein